MGKSQNQTVYLCSLLMVVAGLGAVAVIHGLGYQKWGTEWQLFDNDLEVNWELTNLKILIPEWMFYIWMVLYCLQVIWVIYGFVALTKDSDGGLSVLPWSVFFMFLLGLAGTIAFVVVWDRREYNSFSIIAAGVASVFYMLSLGISVFAVKRHGNDLRYDNFGCDVTFIQVFLHNGVGAMAAWLPCVTAYVMAYILFGENIVDKKDTAEYIALGIIGLYFLLFLLVDTIGFNHASSYILLPYLVYVLSFVMVVVQNYGDGENFNTMFKVGLGATCGSGFLMLIKLFIILACSRSHPVVEEVEGGAVQYQEDYYYEKDHDSSQAGLVHY